MRIFSVVITYILKKISKKNIYNLIYFLTYLLESCCKEIDSRSKMELKGKNLKSNVLTLNLRMTHTKEISGLQGSEDIIGYCEKIVFCPSCNGTGEEGDNILCPIICKECKGTGRYEI